MTAPIRGTDLARELDPEAAAAAEAMQQQLLIVFLNRLGGKITIPIDEIDATGQYLFALRLDEVNRQFVFEILKKS